MQRTDHDALPYRACVGVMLANRDGAVFVGRRADRSPSSESDGHWWQMPQGGIDKGETAEDAALRELYEETGVRSARTLARSRLAHRYDLPVDLAGRAWKGRYRGQEQIWFLLRFEGPDSEIVLDPPGCKQEFDRWRWADVDELPGLVVPFKRPVYEAVIAEFAPLL
jgi:putative (di)nucleoside polyphosphate hydrolase